MKYFLISLIIFLPFLATSQIKMIPMDGFDSNQQEVLEVVLTLFDGMREADSAKVRSAFGQAPQLYTSFTDGEGIPVLNKNNLQKFLNAVGTPHDQVWDEPIWDIKINIDGNLASVWTKYAFYAGKSFSHCGVDAFMLNKEQNDWKIFYLTDTRRKQNCIVPNQIKKNRN